MGEQMVWCVMVRNEAWAVTLDGVSATRSGADVRADYLRSADGGYKRVQVWDMALQGASQFARPDS